MSSRASNVSKLLIDISHIHNWSGHLTGIERVEYHIIKHYLNHGSVKFIRWDPSRKKFLVVSKKFVERNIINRLDDAHHKGLRAKIMKATMLLDKSRMDHWTADEVADVLVLAGLWDDDEYIYELQNIAKNNKLFHIVYDMIPYVKPEYVVEFLPAVFINYMNKILPLSNGIFAISSSTAIDVKKILEAQNIPVPHISVFKLGNDVGETNTQLQPPVVSGEFILCVGTIEARKNHMLLYYAYKAFCSQKVSVPKLVLAGKRGWLTENLQYILSKDQDLKDKIIILESTSDAELGWLYKNCEFTVFPSFYEGWGLPVAESLEYGKVTLSSNTSSMKEAGEGYADYFSPYSTSELMELILKYTNKTVRESRENHVSGYSSLSWQRSSELFSIILQKVREQQRTK